MFLCTLLLCRNKKKSSDGCTFQPNVPKLTFSASRIPQKLSKVEACYMLHTEYSVFHMNLFLLHSNKICNIKENVIFITDEKLSKNRLN